MAREVSGPLGEVLARAFGREVTARSDVAGQLGIVALRLSKPPGEVVVTPAFKSGDKSVSLAEGARLVFDDSNWNKPALACFNSIPSSDRTTAVFEVRSGNIPLSWTITFRAGRLVSALRAWHKFILPHPASEISPATRTKSSRSSKEFFKTFGAFFRKPAHRAILLLFLLLYRFGEAQLVKMVAPFLLDAARSADWG